MPQVHRPADVAVLLQGDDAVERRLHHQAVDDLLGALHGEHRLLALLLRHRHRRLVVRGARLDVFVELRQPALRLFERQHVLLRGDGGDELVAHHVELGAAHVELRREQRDVVLRLLHGGVGRHLRDFLLGLGNFRLRLLERELLIGRIELHHHVVFLDRHAGLDQR